LPSTQRFVAHISSGSPLTFSQQETGNTFSKYKANALAVGASAGSGGGGAAAPSQPSGGNGAGLVTSSTPAARKPFPSQLSCS
jgi:hypothetical protein